MVTGFAMLAELTKRPLAHAEKKEAMLVGGVGANKRLGEMLDIMCQERGARFFLPSNKFMSDNGSMIAYTGLTMMKSGTQDEPGGFQGTVSNMVQSSGYCERD